MTLLAGELELQRRNTQAFIDSNPTTLTLIPRTRVKRGSGFQWIEGQPRAPQVLRVIDQSSTRGPVQGSVHTADGVERRVEYQLLGNYQAAIGLYDTWVDANGLRWEIAELLPDNGYERRAQVVRRGES